jgi:hypothetical protein
MTCELKTFELALNMLKFNLKGSLNFERTPLKLQKAIKSKNNNGERSLGGGGCGAWVSRQFDFLGKNFDRPKALVSS